MKTYLTEWQLRKAIRLVKPTISTLSRVYGESTEFKEMECNVSIWCDDKDNTHVDLSGKLTTVSYIISSDCSKVLSCNDPKMGSLSLKVCKIKHNLCSSVKDMLLNLISKTSVPIYEISYPVSNKDFNIKEGFYIESDKEVGSYYLVLR